MLMTVTADSNCFGSVETIWWSLFWKQNQTEQNRKKKVQKFQSNLVNSYVEVRSLASIKSYATKKQTNGSNMVFRDITVNMKVYQQEKANLNTF